MQVATLVADDLTQFRTAVAESFVPLHVSSDHPDLFSGTIRNLTIDDIHVSEVAASSHSVERTSSLIARGDQPYYKLSLQIAGTGLLVQDHREAVLRPGDLAIYDTDRPYSLVFDEQCRLLVVMFPRHLIDLPAATLATVTAMRIDSAQGVGRLVAPFLEHLASNLEGVASRTSSRLATNAIDLISTMLASELDVGLTGDPHRLLMNRVRAFIEQHLGSTELSPAMIAAEHYISTRHLHALFREQNTTVSSWVRARRLERSRRDLVDPLQNATPVAAIGARWGFADAAHFSRAFKAAFGASPSEVRRTS